MNYIVLDLEWNQPKSLQSMIVSPMILRGEIIQIGAVKLDKNYCILDTFKIMVSPKYYTKMNKKVSKLTGIQTADLQYGFPFPKAIHHFKRWCGEDFAFLTWGSEDIAMLRDNMILHKLSAEWIPAAYNLQAIFDDQITKENRQVSLSCAVEMLGESTFKSHDALNDARSTVSVCIHLDMAKGLAEYALLQNRINCGGAQAKERIRSPRVYQTRAEALKDPEMVSFYCPICSSYVICTDFVRQNYTKYICVGKCENGDELFVRFKFNRLPDGRFSVSRIIYEMDDENRAYFLSKKQQVAACS